MSDMCLAGEKDPFGMQWNLGHGWRITNLNPSSETFEISQDIYSKPPSSSALGFQPPESMKIKNTCSRKA